MALSDASNALLIEHAAAPAPLRGAHVTAARAEQRFWWAVERLSEWCGCPTGEATLTASDADDRAIAESSPVWGYVTAMAELAERRCSWMAGHSIRVANLLGAVARQLRLGGDVRRYLRLAGLLHDVGNIRVPVDVLAKRTGLSAEEYSVVQHHSEAGASIVRQIAMLRPVATGIHYHHERLDGHGYPAGLSGEEIPLIARMVGAACCFDAMISSRPYREPMDPDRALETMCAGAGEHWDAHVVHALVQIIS